MKRTAQKKERAKPICKLFGCGLVSERGGYCEKHFNERKILKNFAHSEYRKAFPNIFK